MLSDLVLLLSDLIRIYFKDICCWFFPAIHVSDSLMQEKTEQCMEEAVHGGQKHSTAESGFI